MGGQFFEVFETQEKIEKSMPAMNIQTSDKPKNTNPFSLDNKKVELSYTMLLFLFMSVVVMLAIGYLLGYVQKERDSLNMLTLGDTTKKTLQNASSKKVNPSISLSTPQNIENTTDEETEDSSLINKEKVSGSSQGSSTAIPQYTIDIFYGKALPDKKFMEGIKKIIKNVLNIEVDVKYTKKDKYFYIIVDSLNTENEANRVIEILRTKKMIAKENGKIARKE